MMVNNTKCFRCYSNSCQSFLALPSQIWSLMEVGAEIALCYLSVCELGSNLECRLGMLKKMFAEEREDLTRVTAASLIHLIFCVTGVCCSVPFGRIGCSLSATLTLRTQRSRRSLRWFTTSSGFFSTMPSSTSGAAGVCGWTHSP